MSKAKGFLLWLFKPSMDLGFDWLQATAKQFIERVQDRLYGIERSPSSSSPEDEETCSFYQNFIQEINLSIDGRVRSLSVTQHFDKVDDVQYIQGLFLVIQKILVVFLEDVLDRSEIALWAREETLRRSVKNKLSDYLYRNLYLMINSLFLEGIENYNDLRNKGNEEKKLYFFNQIKMFFESDIHILRQINAAKYRPVYSTKLFDAIKNDETPPSTIVELCALGANPNVNLCKDSWNWTALHWAAYWGRSELIEPLVRIGANLTAQDCYGQTPFMVCIRYLRSKNSDTRIVEAILEQARVAFSDQEYSHYINKHLPNDKDGGFFKGMTPFHIAYYESKHAIYKDTAMLLIEFEADIFRPTTKTNNKAWDNKTIEDAIFRKNNVPASMLKNVHKHKKLTLEFNKEKKAHSVSPTVKPSPSRPESNFFKKIDTSWYTDEQINPLFNRIQQTYPQVHVLDAMLGTNWIGAEGNENILQTNLLAFSNLRQRAISLNQPVANRVLIPVNLDHSHWALLLIHYPLESSQEPAIFYFDPFGAPIHPDVLQTLRNAFFSPELHVSHLEKRLQNDGYNCGPWIVVVAEMLISKNCVPEVWDVNIREERKRQQRLLHEMQVIGPAFDGNDTNQLALVNRLN
ncbi:MAG: ankyrin repeat domain-containing protein [Gammaproteobacteria bacterium]|nr:ankyrin repeat domain-containing protein [Gammaproteobacteria bacterium]